MSGTGFEGRGVVVTGAASGIGRPAALMFAEEGAKVLGTDLDKAGADETAKVIETAGGTAVAVAGDLSDPQVVDEVVATAVRSFGGLDVQRHRPRRDTDQHPHQLAGHGTRQDDGPRQHRVGQAQSDGGAAPHGPTILRSNPGRRSPPRRSRPPSSSSSPPTPFLAKAGARDCVQAVVFAYDVGLVRPA
jgi:hypothetical protein